MYFLNLQYHGLSRRHDKRLVTFMAMTVLVTQLHWLARLAVLATANKPEVFVERLKWDGASNQLRVRVLNSLNQKSSSVKFREATW